MLHFGIPMCLLVLADLGQILTGCVRKLCFLTWRCFKNQCLGKMIASWCVKKSKWQQKITVNDFQRVAKVILSTGEVRKVLLSSGAENRFAKLARQARENKKQEHSCGEKNGVSPDAGTSNLPQKKKPGLKMADIARSLGSIEANKIKTDVKTPQDIIFNEEDFDPPPILTIFLMVIFILISGGVFMAWEEWNYVESVYFNTITLTTIGFGDFMPYHKKYFLAMFIYLFFGLALVSMVINSLIVYGQKGVEEMGKILDIDDDEEEDIKDKSNV